MIYNKKYTFHLCLVSGIELLKPLEFLSEECNQGVFCYANEASFWTPPTHSRGLVTRETVIVIRWLELSVLLPDLQGGERGPEVEPIANGQLFTQSCLCSEASRKTPKAGF